MESEGEGDEVGLGAQAQGIGMFLSLQNCGWMGVGGYVGLMD